MDTIVKYTAVSAVISIAIGVALICIGDIALKDKPEWKNASKFCIIFGSILLVVGVCGAVVSGMLAHEMKMKASAVFGPAAVGVPAAANVPAAAGLPAAVPAPLRIQGPFY